jgi:hypothetical protein
VLPDTAPAANLGLFVWRAAIKKIVSGAKYTNKHCQAMYGQKFLLKEMIPKQQSINEASHLRRVRAIFFVRY